MTLLYLMFSTGEDEIVRREGLFGSLFFETEEVREGTIGATMGVDNPAALIVIFVLFLLFLTVTQFVYQGLKSYREQLLEERVNS